MPLTRKNDEDHLFTKNQSQWVLKERKPTNNTKEYS